MIALTLRALIPLCLVAAAATAQDPPEPTPPQPPPAWPDLSGAEQETAKLELRRLGADDPEVAAAAEDALAGLGAGVAPLLLARLSDRKPAHPDALRRVLDRVVAPHHAPLCADKAQSRSALVREWAVEFLALHHDERWRATLQKAAKDPEREVVFRAALGLTALGDLDAAAEVFAQCEAGEWRDHAELVGRVLAPARGAALAEWTVRRMPRDDERAVVTGLRLLRSLAPKEYAGVVVTFLDAEQHAVKKEAINTLRVVVDGDPPLENLSVFQAIDQARKWQERIR